jgi:hypothetical protein
MAERKQTPDVLGDLLGGGPPAPEPQKAAPAPKPKAATRQTKAPAKRTTRRSRAKPVRWQYMEVVFRDYGGYRPRYLNGEEQEGWKKAPVIHEYLNQLGAEGWELVGVGSREDREMPTYFKRQQK